MRLYLFPITPSRTLIYCKRSNIAAAAVQISKSASESPSQGPQSPSAVQHKAFQKKPSIVERIQAKANETWVKWESEPRGWKSKVTGWGNQAFARIPYQEWGLKSIPPLSKARKEQETQLARISPDDVDLKKRMERRSAEVDVVFPTRLIEASKVIKILEELSANKHRNEYRKRIWWSVIGMPFTIPFALVPIVPNLPFFYLVWRAWSYWRAQAGCAHIQHLLANDLVSAQPSRLLQRIYDAAPLGEQKIQALQKEVDNLKDAKQAEHTDHPDQVIESATMSILGDAGPEDSSPQSGSERLLFPKGHGKAVALALNLPELEAELERAHDQVSKTLEKEKEAGKEKRA